MDFANCIPLGTVLRVRTFGGLVWHKGIVSGQSHSGEVMVISGSARQGCVVQEPLSQFAQGGRVFVDGYPGLLSPDEVMMRARCAIGLRWNLFTANCEHFVRWFHGLTPRSEQVDQVLTATLGILAVCALAKTST